MREKEQLDEWLRERLSGREFPFREAYWEAAEALIEAQERRRRRWMVIWLNSLGLLLALALPAAMWWGAAAGNANLTQQMPLSAAAQPANGEEVCLEIATQEPAPAAVASLPAELHVSPPASLLSPASPPATASLAGATRSATHSPKKETARVTTGTSFSLPPTNDPAAKAIWPDTDTRHSASPLFSNPAAAIEALPAAGETMGRADDLIRPSTRFSEELHITNSRSVQARNPGLEKIDVSLPAEALAGTWALTAPERKIPAWGKHRGRHSFGWTLGTGLSSAWANAESASQPTIASPLAGLTYRYHFGRSLSLQTGLRYQSRGGLHVSHRYVSTDFAFGIESRTTTIAPQRLHTLEMPLLLSFPVGIARRHRLQAGLDLHYLLEVYSEVQEISQDAFTTQTLSQKMAWGYRQGFRRMDMGVQVGYRFWLNRRMQVGLDVRYGLRDLTDDVFFESSLPQRNVQVRWVGEYDLIRF